MSEPMRGSNSQAAQAGASALAEPSFVGARFHELFVWYLADPNRPALVGRLAPAVAPSGVSLTYAPSWLQEGFALSADMPLLGANAGEPYRPHDKGQAAGAVNDARPDRWGEAVIRYVVKPKDTSLMGHLYFAGEDRFGALGVSTSADQYLPFRQGPMPRLESLGVLRDAVSTIAQGGRDALTQVQRQVASRGGSLGGAKPKGLITMEGREWIIKFFNNEPYDLPLIEHAAMTLAKTAGIRVASTRPIALVGETALAVLRFDRLAHGARLPAQRIHCLSAATALRAANVGSAGGAMAAAFGYPALALLLQQVGPQSASERGAQIVELFRRMVFNILIGNTDDHERNHVLMRVPEPGRASGRLRRAAALGVDAPASLCLSPAFDVLPSNSGQGHHEFLIGDDAGDPSLDNAFSQCALFGLTRAQAAKEAQRVVRVVNGWRAHFSACGVSSADLALLDEVIDDPALKQQRAAFNTRVAARPAAAPVPAAGQRFRR